MQKLEALNRLLSGQDIATGDTLMLIAAANTDELLAIVREFVLRKQGFLAKCAIEQFRTLTLANRRYQYSLPVAERSQLGRAFPNIVAIDRRSGWSAYRFNNFGDELYRKLWVDDSFGPRTPKSVAEGIRYSPTVVDATYHLLTRPYIRRILDFGCASGNMIPFFEVMSWWPQADYRGVDVSENFIAAARQVHHRLADRFSVVPARQPLPFEDRFFDFVFANGALHYCVDRDGSMATTIRELCRVSNREIHVGCHYASRDEDFPEAVQIRTSPYGTAYLPISLMTIKTLTHHFERNGFSLAHTELSSDMPAPTKDFDDLVFFYNCIFTRT
jgi:SAM-dependent methyltransferase